MALTAAKERLVELNKKIAVSEHIISELIKQIKDDKILKEGKEIRLKKLILAQAAIQKITDLVSTQNLRRIEELTNSTLAAIFTDQDLKIRIDTSIKRNQTSYEFTILKDGIPGNQNNFGGSVIVIIGLILKCIVNIVGGKFRLIAMDESLAAVSAEYIASTSQFIRAISRQFKIPILLVTHQPALAASADTHIRLGVANDGKTAYIENISHNFDVEQQEPSQCQSNIPNPQQENPSSEPETTNGPQTTL